MCVTSKSSAKLRVRMSESPKNFRLRRRLRRAASPAKPVYTSGPHPWQRLDRQLPMLSEKSGLTAVSEARWLYFTPLRSGKAVAAVCNEKTTEGESIDTCCAEAIKVVTSNLEADSNGIKVEDIVVDVPCFNAIRDEQ